MDPIFIDSQFQTTQSIGITNGNPFALPISTFDFNYGILNIKTKESERDKSVVKHLICNVDRSASMDMGAGANFNYNSSNTKMKYLKQTMKNLIHWIADQTDEKFYLTIIAFDNDVEVPIEHVLVEKSNTKDLISAVEDIHPRGSTNIELALETANDILTKYADSSTIQTQIFMTDGEITAGSSSKHVLKGLVDSSYFQSFIGYGTDHNVSLLKNLSSDLKSNYYFVESIENTGMVYGELINNVINNLVDNVEFHMQDGAEIYNFYTNTWSNLLEVGSLPSNISKTYHVRYPVSLHGRNKRLMFNHPVELTMNTKYRYESNSFNSISKMKVVNRLNNDFNDFHGRMVEKYMWRLKTLEYLYKFSGESSLNTLERMELKQFLENMRLYIQRFHLQDDTFMKTLCDDIYVIIKASRSHLAHMFINARQSSQGHQRAYNTADLDELVSSPSQLFARPPRIGRPRNVRFNVPSLSDSDDEDEFDDYQMSNDATTPYINGAQSRLMRTLSSQPVHQ